MGKDANQIRHEIDNTREEMGDTVEAIGYRANIPRRVKDSISDTVDAVKDRVSETTADVRATVSEKFSQLNEHLPDVSQIKEGARQAVGTVRDNPLALALGALTLGFVLGLLVPSTVFEQNRIGPMSARAKQKAREAGRRVMSNVGQRAKDIVNGVASAEREDITNR